MARTDGVDFVAFWDCFPRKIGKLAAMKAYEKARRSFSAEEILAGVQLYVQHMPDDPQYRVHPTTFLNQGRFLDEYDVPKVVKPKPAAGAYKLYVPLKDRVG